MTGHQPESTKGTVQSLQGIAGIEDLKGILQRVTAPTINGGIDLNVPPREDQKSGAKLVNGDAQNPMHIQNRQSSQIKNPLRNSGKAFVQMISEIDRADRKNGIAGQTDQQHPFAGKLGLSQELRRLQEALHGLDANNHVAENA